MVIFSILLSFVSFRYGSIGRQDIKKRFGLDGLVETHHLIPKQWKNHPIITRYEYDISENYNLIFMPTHLGLKKLNTNRLLHTGGHKPYNQYVKYNLDLIDNKSALDEFCAYLRYSMKGNPDNIPWK